MQDPRKYVKDNLSETAILLQLCEEASELAAAAAKMLRVMEGENPTPVTAKEARDHLIEEYSDVHSCIDLLFTVADYAKADRIHAEKMARWAERIQEKKG